jgi:hypothetical protein
MLVRLIGQGQKKGIDYQMMWDEEGSTNRISSLAFIVMSHWAHPQTPHSDFEIIH